MPLTLEEFERRAFIEGRTEVLATLAAIEEDDGIALVSGKLHSAEDYNALEREKEGAEEERDEAQDQVSNLGAQLDIAIDVLMDRERGLKLKQLKAFAEVLQKYASDPPDTMGQRTDCRRELTDSMVTP